MRRTALLLTVSMLAGCEPGPAELKDVNFNVAVQNIGSSLNVKVSVMNRRLVPVAVGYGPCFSQNVRVRLYTTADMKAPAVWDSDDLAGMCHLNLFVETVLPRATVSPPPLRSEMNLPSSLPDGTYFATAAIHLDRIDSGELAAGTVVLRRR